MQTRAHKASKRSATVRRVGIYIRISKDRANEISTDVQEKLCRQYAADRDWQIIDVYIDRGRSAYKANVRRPAHDRALDDLDVGAIDTLLIYRLDRLSRSAADFGMEWRRINKAGGEFVSVCDGFDTTTAMGEAMVQIAMVFAQLESGIKSERITDWHEHRAANGSSPTGPRAFGYGPGRKIVDKEAALIRDAAKRITGGESLRSIVTNWNGRKIRTANGRQWSNRALRHVLCNPHTAGMRRVDDELVKGTWPAILRRPTWEKVCIVLEDPGRRTGPGPARKHLLSGIALCDTCSTPMGVKSNVSGTRYTCLPRAGYEACTKVSIAIADTDIVVRDAIRDALANANLANALKTADPAALARALDQELAQLAADYGTGAITRTEWVAARSGIEERLATAQQLTASGPRRLNIDLRRFDQLPLAQQRLVVGWALELRVKPADRTKFGIYDNNRLVYDWKI